MYPRGLKLMNWAALCFGLVVCVASFQAVAEAPQSLKEQCLTQNYPPPPADKTKLPEPVSSCIQMIMDLCQHDKNGRLTLTLKEQAPLLKSALKGLRQALPYYIKHKYYSYDPGEVNSLNPRLNLRRIRSNLFNDSHTDVFWKYVKVDHRYNIEQQFLHGRIILYNFPDGAGPEYFSRDWEHQIYEGLYCISHGKLPPASSFPVKTM